jgi:hypothetical protein
MKIVPNLGSKRWKITMSSTMDYKEASQKDWDMDFSVRLEGKPMFTSKIDLTYQACCRCIKTELCLEYSPSKREKTMARHLIQ